MGSTLMEQLDTVVSLVEQTNARLAELIAERDAVVLAIQHEEDEKALGVPSVARGVLQARLACRQRAVETTLHALRELEAKHRLLIELHLEHIKLCDRYR